MDSSRLETAKALAKIRHHSASQLMARPITFGTCSGDLTIAVVEAGEKLQVVIIHPPGVPVSQPKLTNEPPPA